MKKQLHLYLKNIWVRWSIIHIIDNFTALIDCWTLFPNILQMGTGIIILIPTVYSHIWIVFASNTSQVSQLMALVMLLRLVLICCQQAWYTVASVTLDTCSIWEHLLLALQSVPGINHPCMPEKLQWVQLYRHAGSCLWQKYFCKNIISGDSL